MKNFRAQLIPQNCRVAVALSGGADSVALLHVLLSLRKEYGWDVKAIHVEHGIRGEHSKQDCAFVQKLCREWGVLLKTYAVDVLGERQKTGESVEECARRLRYDCFRAALGDGFCDCVVTAHHLSDFAETVLMRLARGTGPIGIQSIPLTAWNGKLLRPMLDVKKQEICDYVAQNGLPFVVDESNEDDAYTRNAVRHHVAPVLSKVYPEWERAVKRYAEITAEDEAYLQKTASALVQKEGETYVVARGESVLARRAFAKALAEMGAQKDVGKAHYDALCDLLSGESGRELYLPSGVRAIAEYGKVRLTTAQKASSAFCVPFAVGSHRLPCGRLEIQQISKRIEKKLCFDLDKLPSGAIIRNRKDGDRFRPFGGGDRKLKEYLIDQKVPREKRDGLPVIAVDNRVYAVVGVQISDEIRVDETTRRIANISFFTEETQDA